MITIGGRWCEREIKKKEKKEKKSKKQHHHLKGTDRSWEADIIGKFYVHR